VNVLIIGKGRSGMKEVALRIIRWSACGMLAAGILAATMLLPGCSSGGSSAGASSPLGRGSMDARLRKQVQADPFPTAQQAGLGVRASGP
jgi:hypothetical protein